MELRLTFNDVLETSKCKSLEDLTYKDLTEQAQVVVKAMSYLPHLKGKYCVAILESGGRQHKIYPPVDTCKDLPTKLMFNTQHPWKIGVIGLNNNHLKNI